MSYASTISVRLFATKLRMSPGDLEALFCKPLLYFAHKRRQPAIEKAHFIQGLPSILWSQSIPMVRQAGSGAAVIAPALPCPGPGRATANRASRKHQNYGEARSRGVVNGSGRTFATRSVICFKVQDSLDRTGGKPALARSFLNC